MADENPGTEEHAEEQQDFSGERRTGAGARPRIGTALVETSTGKQMALQYLEVNGMAMVEGDIALGPVGDVEQQTDSLREDATRGIQSAVAITGVQYRWTNCTVPYEIDPNLPNQQRVTDAIAHWQAKTGLKFVVRTTQANWVYFTDADGCWSYVGMRGGRQTISVSAGCTTGNTIHEIGHAVGLWHEQSREDRDTFVTINWANIQSGKESNFSQHINDGEDIGEYDYGSIMHYPRKAFSKNGQDTIVPVDSSAQIGQRTGLSDRDIAAIRELYPACHRVVKHPRLDQNFKKILDDRRFKKIYDDERVIKPLRDVIVNPIGPIKLDTRPEITRPQVVTPATGTLRPFALATPHHADLAEEAELDQAAADSAAQAAVALQQQLLEVEAALSRAKAAVADATLEVTRLESVRADVEAAYLEVMQSLPDPEQLG